MTHHYVLRPYTQVIYDRSLRGRSFLRKKLFTPVQERLKRLFTGTVQRILVTNVNKSYQVMRTCIQCNVRNYQSLILIFFFIFIIKTHDAFTQMDDYLDEDDGDR